MPYKILADLTILLHFLWIVFLVMGGLWGRRRRAVKYVHVGGLGFAFAINLFGFYCPLRTWRYGLGPGTRLGPRTPALS